MRRYNFLLILDHFFNLFCNFAEEYNLLYKKGISMRQAVWIFFFFICLCVFSCKESDDDNTVVNNNTQTDQDQDTATITGDDYIYHLPVIFHVLYQDSKADSQYIAHKRLKNILSYVNELYQGNVYGESENIHVQFELAEYDEKGNKLSTPGVEYIKYTATYPIDCDQFMEGETKVNGKSYLWDPNEYINVFVYNFAQDKANKGITLGISHMPYKALGYPQLEGLDSVKTTKLNKSNFGFPYCVSINSIYADVAYESSRYTDPSKGKGGNSSYSSVDVSMTLAHELGHFLGLHHIFTQDDEGEMADSSADTDYCEDTPSYNRPEYQEWVSWLMKDMQAKGEQIYMDTVILRTNCNGEKWRSANLLDYSYSLGYKFSKDQTARMRQVLYYSPALPGPKKARTSSSRAEDQGVEGILNLPIRLAKCTIPKLQ